MELNDKCLIIIALNSDDKELKLSYCDSSVAIDNNKFAYISVYNKGDISSIGKTLLDNYTNRDKVFQLVANGNLLSASDNIDKELCEDYVSNKHRTKGALLIRKHTRHLLYFMVDWHYIYKNNQWYYRVNPHIKWRLLTKQAILEYNK